MQLKQYFEESCDGVNQAYFESLWHKFKSGTQKSLSIFHPQTNKNSLVFPYAILKEKELIPIKNYSDLRDVQKLNSELRLVKMHAGLGSSVKRKKYLKEATGRTSLGSKSSDLFIEGSSIAELQIKQAEILAKNYNIKIQNLVNEETKAIVGQYKSELMLAPIEQFKMPTISENSEPTLERMAPGGHAFLGFYLLMELFKNPIEHDQIIAIGNGEDLNSTPDSKILTWMEREDVPICMITTTKTKCDKKGGQIAVVKGDISYLTIVEKAQAEEAGQLDYFQELGLRAEDDISLFNTNIVLINAKIISDSLKKLELSESEFADLISPDLIQNIKEQDGREFIQLEGAIASVILNLDKYFRENFKRPLIQFLNLNPQEREQFFIPIKKFEDFESILARYNYDNKTGRLVLK